MANKIILYCRLHPYSKVSTLSSAKLKMNNLLSNSLTDQVHNLSNFSRAFRFLTNNKKVGVILGEKITLSHYMSICVIIISEKKF